MQRRLEKRCLADSESHCHLSSSLFLSEADDVSVNLTAWTLNVDEIASGGVVQ